MQIITTKSALQAVVKACKQENKTIGLVPTMGALHNGHASLVKRAVEENDICIVSVFVNPTQFNNKEDLAKYPRNIERDAKLLESIGADYVFAPTPEEMYSAEEMNTTFEFDFAGLDKVMEGKMRPGHFNGVVQVVSRLFYLTQPDKGYFGVRWQAHSVSCRSSIARLCARIQVWRSPAAMNACLRRRNRQLSLSPRLFLSRSNGLNQPR